MLVAPLAVTAFVLKLLADRSLVVADPLVRGTGLPAYTGNVELAARALALGVIATAPTALGWLDHRLLLVPESQVHENEMGVRQGLRAILTTGVAAADRAGDRGESAESPADESPPRARV